jgi:hypothetical protein
MSPAPLRRVFHPVTPERLPALQRFLQQHGKFRYCACMRWRMRSSFEPGPRLYTYMGSPSIFRAAGFQDVTPIGQARQVVRYFVKSA